MKKSIWTKNKIPTVRNKMMTLRNKNVTIRNEVIVVSGTQTPLDKANKKLYEFHYARTTYPEHISDKTKKS